MDRQPEYIVDARTGKTLRVVRRVPDGASQQPRALPPPQSSWDRSSDQLRYVQRSGSGQQMIVVRRADPPRQVSANTAKRRSGGIISTLVGVIIIGALWLIPGMVIPRSPVGMMSAAWGGTIRAVGSGIGEFARGMITEPDKGGVIETTSTDAVTGRWSGSSERLRVDVSGIDGKAGDWTVHGIVTNISDATITISTDSFTLLEKLSTSENSMVISSYRASGDASAILAPGESTILDLGISSPSTNPIITMIVSFSPDQDLIIDLWDRATDGAGNTASPPAGGNSVADADLSLVGSPSITATKIDGILAGYGSPATGTGKVWVAAGQKYKIDPAFAVAFFIHESGAGTNQAWAGLKPGGATTHNVGNIICAGYATCYGRFRDYSGWDVGIEDWFRLIREEYIDMRGADTLLAVIKVYAPETENDVDAYVASVANLVRGWWAESASSTASGATGAVPLGSPLGDGADSVMTQGYGVGSHAPAESWGAIDLAVDGDGDGYANPDATTGHPVYATMSGRVTVTPNSWPAGNHIWVTGDQYRVGYSHLLDFAAEDGAMVSRGDLIGHVGSTGMSSGPHLDYQIWEMRGGQWVNRNPLDFGSSKA